MGLRSLFLFYMDLKKYLYIDVVDNLAYRLDFAEPEDMIKLKVVQGFLKSDVEKILNVQSTWAPLESGSDRLYFFPGCNVPRFKVRERYSVTTKPSCATAAFISKNALVGSNNGLDYYPDLMPVTRDEIKNWISQLNQTNVIMLFNSIMDNGNIEEIFASKRLWQNRAYSSHYTRDYTYFAENLSSDKRNKWNRIARDDKFQLFSFKKNMEFLNISCDIFFEEALLSKLNDNNIIIDDEKYKEFRAFGLTNDKENNVLLMELMSNCNFEKSVVNLLFLLEEFGKNFKDLNEANHVNFKSLLSYLNLDVRNLDKININDVTHTLRLYKKFTRTNALKVSMLFAGNSIHYGGASSCWCHGPVLKSDCESLLNDDV